MAETEKKDTKFASVEEDLELEDMDEFEEEGGLLRKVMVWGGSALGIIILLLIVLVVGFFWGKGSADPGPAEVESIKSQNSVLDSLDTLKDSQVKSLNEEVTTLKQKIEAGETDSTDGKLAAPKEAIDPLNAYTDVFYAMPFQADEAQQKQVASNLDSLGEATQDETPGAKRDTLGQRVVSGDSPAKQMKATGKKAGGVTVFYSDRNANGNPVLVGLVPFATKDATHETLFVATVDNGKVSDFQFVGVVDGPAETFEQARARMIEQKDGR